jgi:hypothetical protein
LSGSVRTQTVAASQSTGHLDQRPHQFPPDPSPAEGFVHAEFVQHHLDALVGVEHLHPRHESGRLVPDVGEEQVVAVSLEEARRPLPPRGFVEQMGGGHHHLDVAGTQFPDLDHQVRSRSRG